MLHGPPLDNLSMGCRVAAARVRYYINYFFTQREKAMHKKAADPNGSGG